MALLRHHRCRLARLAHDVALHLRGSRVCREADAGEWAADRERRRDVYLPHTARYVDAPIIMWSIGIADADSAIDQVEAGTVDVSYIDETVKTVLRTKFSLGLFESMSRCHIDVAVLC